MKKICSEFIFNFECNIYNKPTEIKDTMIKDVATISAHKKIKLRHKKQKLDRIHN